MPELAHSKHVGILWSEDEADLVLAVPTEAVAGATGFVDVSGAVALNLASSRVFLCRVTGNVTGITLTNAPDANKAGAECTLVLKMDETGGYTIDSPFAMTFLDGRSWDELDTSANAVNIVRFVPSVDATYGALAWNGMLELGPYKMSFPDNGQYTLLTERELIDLPNVSKYGDGVITYTHNDVGVSLATAFEQGDRFTVTCASATEETTLRIPRYHVWQASAGAVKFARFTSGADTGVGVPYASGRDLSGEFEVRVKLRVDGAELRPTARRYLIGQGAAGTAGWLVNIEQDGRIRTYLRTGTDNNYLTSSALPTGLANAIFDLRVRRDAAGLVTWHYSTNDGDTWLSLGSSTAAGALTAHTSSGIGVTAAHGTATGVLSSFVGHIMRARVWKDGNEGVGTLIVDCDMSLAALGTPASFTGGVSETWTFYGAAYEVVQE